MNHVPTEGLHSEQLSLTARVFDSW